MHPLVEVGLLNAAFAIPLALLVAIVSFVFRRPALSHVLWVLVLVKLITPPVWDVELLDWTWVSQTADSFNSMIDRSIAEDRQTTIVVADHGNPDERLQVNSRSRPRTLPPGELKSPWWPHSWMRPSVIWLRTSQGQRIVGYSLLIVWLVGTVVWFSIQSNRCVRFARALRLGKAAPHDIQLQLTQLAGCSNCRRTPIVWLLPGTLSPMLWSTGTSTRLVFPEELFHRMKPAARETLLAHELAHLLRGDHWVRWISLFSTGLFWWHPVVWWARYAIEAAEEECCDAWVVTHGTNPPRRYAEAILETVDFLAERQWHTPPLATGLGQLPFLRQRLIWIMRGPRRQDISRIGRLLCVLMVVCLPLRPTWLIARQPASSSPPQQPGFEGGSILEPPHTSMASNWMLDDSPLNNETIEFMRGRPSSFSVSSVDMRFLLHISANRQMLADTSLGRVMDLTSYGIQVAAFSPDGISFVTGGRDGFVRVWNAETFAESWSWQNSKITVNSVAFSSDGNSIAAGCSDGLVRVWRFDGDRSTLQEFPREAAPVSCVRFSDDGRLLAVSTGEANSSTGGRLIVWNLIDTTELISMNWNSPSAVVAFGRQAHTLYSGDWIGRVARWNIETGELLGFVEGQKEVITSSMVSPETSRLSDVAVPELPLDFLVGNANQDERVKSLWEQLSKRVAVIRRSTKSGDLPQPMP